jgi:cell division protein FtsB
MIYVNYIGNTLILIGAGVIVVALAILAIAVIRRNSRLTRELESALAGKEHLKAENGKLQETNADLYSRIKARDEMITKLAQENIELEARHTALSKTLEAQPTAPKRAVQRRAVPPPTEGA